MKAIAAILLALFFAGCSSPKPPPSGYDQPWDADNTNTVGTVQP